MKRRNQFQKRQTDMSDSNAMKGSVEEREHAATMTLPASTAIEVLMEATEPVLIEGGSYSDYSDWEDRFQRKFALCLPLVEYAMLKQVRAECGDILREPRVRVSVAYYGRCDYLGLFTIQVQGARADLDAIRRDLLRSRPINICGSVPDEILVANAAAKMVWGDDIAPCQSWLARDLVRPVWPPLVQAIPARQSR
jgi:hypothetical protein